MPPYFKDEESLEQTELIGEYSKMLRIFRISENPWFSNIRLIIRSWCIKLTIRISDEDNHMFLSFVYSNVYIVVYRLYIGFGWYFFMQCPEIIQNLL